MGLLNGKVALITGAARGIGKAIALKYASEGADIAFTDLVINEAAEATVKEIEAYGVKVKAYASNAANFEEIARAMSPVAPDKVAVEMKPFIESLPKPLETTKDLLSIDDEQYDELPQPLRELYLKYDSAREEALEYHYSPFLCQEDKQDAADKMNLAYKEFKDALFEKLNVKEGQSLQPVKTIRETPSEAYKDFNDELLDKKQYALTDVIETAFDDAGIDLTVERQEENEETKHHGFKR